ncbi:hypothetical protein F9L33_00505 [Amylibacter sp. SFDW26]|uniref:beta-propeller fold lactonase family protein n=1 Tax=Amylibacter sp. SFDW26 TaxID=2652722 RepID=UPI00126290D8|nr:beta-propeller fold lactonase family protein [Amylibacter sp. SFDW26]KAB7615285.1 hypothetical protein F9L33_00505 [Amylibacter sp. SFDW26]
MVDFTKVATIIDDAILQLQGVSDLEVVTIGTDQYVFVASEADSTITSFLLRDGLPPQVVDTLEFGADTGTFAVTQANISMINGHMVLLPSGRLDDEVATYRIDSNGQFSEPILQTPNGVDISRFDTTFSIEIDGKTFLYVSQTNTSGISSYRMKPNDTFITQPVYDAGSLDYLGDVSAFASVVIRGTTYMFTASAFDAGLNSFRVGIHGNLHLRDSVAPTDTSGFNLPQALEVTTVGAQTFLIMASSGTNSLTVYSINNRGELTETDHLIDSLETRFQDASVLEIFTFNQRSFVLAAGSDDGVTLLELSPNGTLSVLETLADDFDTTLNNITDIEVTFFGGIPHALVSSGSENGFTQFEIGIESIGANIIGSNGHDTLNGTELDDIITGFNGTDYLYGGDGDDLIIDGDGRDRMFGGAGADIFQFVDDDKRDFIMDYETGIDVIDFSSIDGISHISDLSIKSRPFGAAIFAGDHVIRIESIDGTRLTIADFTADDFIF